MEDDELSERETDEKRVKIKLGNFIVETPFKVDNNFNDNGFTFHNDERDNERFVIVGETHVE